MKWGRRTSFTGNPLTSNYLWAAPSAAGPLWVTANAQKMSFGRPGASILAPWGPFWHLGAPWGTMGAAGWTRGGPESDLYQFWVDFGTPF